MKRIYSHIIYTCLTIILLAGCKSDYPHIEYEGNPGKVEFGNIETDIPIMISMNDPLYENHTRGIGVTNKNTDKLFYIYAFYTPEGMPGVPTGTDYTQSMDSRNDENFYCLVDNASDDASDSFFCLGHGKKAHLSDVASALEWVDTMVWYNSSYPQYRYKFFAYHLDDAADMSEAPFRSSDYVSYDIKIDGTQDLMCSCAQPTPEQLARIKSLSSPSNKDFINNLDKLTYSTESAHRDLIPVFKMEHQLAYIKFYLKTDSIITINSLGVPEKSLDRGVDSVFIENISIRNAPYKGEFVVASEDINRLGVTFKADETTVLYMPVKNEEGKLMPGKEEGFDTPYKPDTLTTIEVGDGFLLPEAERYDLRLECKQHKRDKDGIVKELDYSQNFVLVPPKDKKFLPGHKYEVTIKVYGMRDIRLQLDDFAWEYGGEIEIGKDD